MAKKKMTIKINWSEVVRIAVGTIILAALYNAYKVTDESHNDDTDKE